MLYAVAHTHLPMLAAYRRTAAQPVEPDLHVPTWSEINRLNRALGLSGARRFHGVRHSLRRLRELPRLSLREIVTLAHHPDERVPLALLHAVRPGDDATLTIDPDRRRLIVEEIIERGCWLQTLGATWNAYFDAVVALDLCMFASAPPLHVAVDALAAWIESVTDPRDLEPALRFRCAYLLELVASHVRCADRAFAERVVARAPLAAAALALNPHVDDALCVTIGDLAVRRLQSLRPSDEHVRHVAQWVGPLLAPRRNLLITLAATRERHCQPSPDVMQQLVRDAELDRVRPARRTSARCRTARLALLALGVPLPHDAAEAIYSEYAACLRSEMIRGTDWQLAPLLAKRRHTLAEAIRDIEFPLHVPAALCAPHDVACRVGRAALQHGATLVAIPLVRVLSRRAFRQCLIRLSDAGPQMVRRLLELATHEQLRSISRACVRRLMPDAETQQWRQALSLIPSARRDPAVRRRLIDTADVYVAAQLLCELTLDEQRQVFGVLREFNPGDALAVLEQDVGGIQRALQAGDFVELLAHWSPEIRLRAQALLHRIGAAPPPVDENRAAIDGGAR